MINQTQSPVANRAILNPPYDALIVVSFGGPEGMDDVMPFLENVLRGRNVTLPRERLLTVAKHYELFGGISPINQQNRNLIAALERQLKAQGPHLPIYFGNRNWHPMLADTLDQMRADGIRQALAFVTSAYSSHSSCRQYLNDIESARQTVGPNAPRVEKLRAFHNHPGFIEANVASVRVALEQIPEERRATTQVVFTAHSIPESMAINCDYAAQLEETSRLVAAALAVEKWRLVYQSRSGSSMQPWLGPDVCEYLRELKAAGKEDVVIAPIGFVSDHMEIVYDLDIKAMTLCRELGLNMIRAATAGTHPRFVEMIRELIMERVDPETPRQAIGSFGPRPDLCAADCCTPKALNNFSPG